MAGPLSPWHVGQASPVHLTPEQLAEFAAALNAYLQIGNLQLTPLTIMGSSVRADDPGMVWVRIPEAEYEALRAQRDGL